MDVQRGGEEVLIPAPGSSAGESGKGPRDLGWRAASGAAWAGLSMVLTQGLHLLQFILLSRFLGPADFGLMAMAVVVVNLMSLPAEAGLGAPLIQRKELPPSAVSSLYWLGILIGGALFGLVALGAPAAGRVFREPGLAALLVWAALPLAIQPLGQPFQWMMERDLQFRNLTRIETVAAVAALVAAVVAALRGFGVFALVVGSVSNSVVKTALLIAVGLRRWRPGRPGRPAELRGTLAFGLNHLGQRVTNFVSANVDQFFIGRFLGAELLGFYSLALNLSNLLSGRLNGVVGRVSFPLFSRLQDDLDLLRRSYLRVQELTSTLNFPIVIGLAVTAPVFVPLFCGPRWGPSVELLQLLALGAMARSVGGTVGPLILARGRTGRGFAWSLLILALHTSGMYMGTMSGSVRNVAWVASGLLWLYVGLTYALLVRPLVGPCLGGYVRSMLPALFISAGMGAAVLGLSTLDRSLPPAARLGAEVLLGVVLYVVFAAVFRPQLLRDLGRLWAKGVPS